MDLYERVRPISPCVVAEEFISQNKATELVNSEGRYYDDEAKVPGTADTNLDEGKVIANSSGGVANAHNITSQDSVLNWQGEPGLHGGDHPTSRWRRQLRSDYHLPEHDYSRTEPLQVYLYD